MKHKAVKEARIGINRLGQPTFNKNEDERHGIYVDNKLMKTYWSKDEATRMIPDMERRYPGKTITVKPIFPMNENYEAHLYKQLSDILKA